MTEILHTATTGTVSHLHCWEAVGLSAWSKESRIWCQNCFFFFFSYLFDLSNSRSYSLERQTKQLKCVSRVPVACSRTKVNNHRLLLPRGSFINTQHCYGGKVRSGTESSNKKVFNLFLKLQRDQRGGRGATAGRTWKTGGEIESEMGKINKLHSSCSPYLSNSGAGCYIWSSKTKQFNRHPAQLSSLFRVFFFFLNLNGPRGGTALAVSGSRITF